MCRGGKAKVREPDPKPTFHQSVQVGEREGKRVRNGGMEGGQRGNKNPRGRSSCTAAHCNAIAQRHVRPSIRPSATNGFSRFCYHLISFLLLKFEPNCTLEFQLNLLRSQFILFDSII